MQRTMKLEIWLAKTNGGGKMEHEIVYEGNTLEDIAKQIDRDNEEILYYMQTGDTKKVQCFLFNGLMIKKAGIAAIKLSEADF